MSRSILIPLAAAGVLSACTASAADYAYAPSYGPQPYVAPNDAHYGAPPAYVPPLNVPPLNVPNAVVLATVADPPPLRAARPGYATCRILMDRTRNGVAFTAIGEFDRPVSGDYSFTVTKRGRSGSSDLVQDGPFRARAGSTETLGNAEISVDRNGGYRAVLKVYSNGRQICRREVNS